MISNAQIERLAILSEECGEVQQVIGKILRHGWSPIDEYGTRYDNREDLEKELADVVEAMRRLDKASDINENRIDLLATHKVRNCLHYQ